MRRLWLCLIIAIVSTGRREYQNMELFPLTVILFFFTGRSAQTPQTHHELLDNAGFESSSFHGNWHCSDCNMTVYTSDIYQGKQSVKVTNRCVKIDNFSIFFSFLMVCFNPGLLKLLTLYSFEIMQMLWYIFNIFSGNQS